jgi:hypothetical protein
MRAADGVRGVLGRVNAGFATAAQGYPVLAGRCARPKPALSSPVLSWLGITGIYSPFTAEPNVNMNVPDPDLPFTASHELAHARGFAREDEANYLGSLACRRIRRGFSPLGTSPQPTSWPRYGTVRERRGSRTSALPR